MSKSAWSARTFENLHSFFSVSYTCYESLVQTWPAWAISWPPSFHFFLVKIHGSFVWKLYWTVLPGANRSILSNLFPLSNSYTRARFRWEFRFFKECHLVTSNLSKDNFKFLQPSQRTGTLMRFLEIESYKI